MSVAPQYTYRQLTIEDVKLLKELLRVFGHAFNDSETYQHAIPSDEYLTNLLGKEHFIVVVAMVEKTVVGGLAAYAYWRNLSSSGARSISTILLSQTLIGAKVLLAEQSMR